MQDMTRRDLLAATAGVVGLSALERPLAATPAVAHLVTPESRRQASGRLKQSVSRWPYQSIPLPQFCKAARDMGLVAIDLLQPDDVMHGHAGSHTEFRWGEHGLRLESAVHADRGQTAAAQESLGDVRAAQLRAAA